MDTCLEKYEKALKLNRHALLFHFDYVPFLGIQLGKDKKWLCGMWWLN